MRGVLAHIEGKGKPMIEFLFDFISPYSYLAWTQVHALGARSGHEVNPRPVLLAGILGSLGTKGPAEVPPRRAYFVKDVIRAAHRAGIALTLPPAHPFNPLLALRVAALDVDAALRRRIVDALFGAVWATGVGIEGPDRVAAVLGDAGIDAAPLLAAAVTPEAKERLRHNTDEALARGAFGVPTMFVDGEMFFGFDSFPAIEAFARGEDPVRQHADMVSRWATLPATATRRP
ncbi:MAG TPA: 2-hydroxychromene-2-carboxylate isomerase [Polyangiaceae bacterium]|jgi:2-hydroxychromene-2-carboxylate isomerase